MGDALPVPKAFVVAEEKVLVPPHRSAHRHAELILLQGFDARSEKIAGVQGVIAQELVHGAVNLVAAGARHHGGGRSAGASVLRGRSLGENAKFLDGVYRRLQRVTAVHAIHIRNSIEQVVIGFRPLAVHRVCLASA